MKLRTTHNSIRIRIRKSELVTLRERGHIEESIDFPGGGRLVFSLVVASEKSIIDTSFDRSHLTVALPLEQADKWMTTAEVGIGAQLPLSTGGQLQLLVEKDFPCLDRPGEDKADFFGELVPQTLPDC